MEKSVPLNAATDFLLHVNFCYILILYIFEYQSCVLSFGSQHMRYRMCPNVLIANHAYKNMLIVCSASW